VQITYAPGAKKASGEALAVDMGIPILFVWEVVRSSEMVAPPKLVN